jgi:hypothetical protein
MFYVHVILILLTLWFANQEYNNGRIEWAMFWAMLVGWDLHALITTL